MLVPAHETVRRKDRTIKDRSEIDAILQASRVMHLALSNDDLPFVVPLFFAHDGDSIYFHSAGAGKKIEMLRKNPKVCFTVTADQGFIESDSACDFEAKHRTVIGFGTAHFIEADSEKTAILDRIVSRFSDKHFEYPASNLRHTTVVRIDVESITGKKHGI